MGTVPRPRVVTLPCNGLRSQPLRKKGVRLRAAKELGKRVTRQKAPSPFKKLKNKNKKLSNLRRGWFIRGPSALHRAPLASFPAPLRKSRSSAVGPAQAPPFPLPPCPISCALCRAAASSRSAGAGPRGPRPPPPAPRALPALFALFVKGPGMLHRSLRGCC